MARRIAIELSFPVRDANLYIRDWQKQDCGPFRIDQAPLDYSKATADKPFLTFGYIPLQTIPATTTTPEVDSTGTISVDSNTACPTTGAPANSNCATYTLVVPASNPSVGLFSSSGFTYSTPVTGDVLFTVDAHAAKPMSGGAPDCSPAEQMTSKDATAMPLKVLPATTTNVAEIDFSSCT